MAKFELEKRAAYKIKFHGPDRVTFLMVVAVTIAATIVLMIVVVRLCPDVLFWLP